MLTPYSSQALSVLLQLLPDLAPLVTIEQAHFELTQIGPAGWALTVSSAEDEVTVYFADHHRHFGWHEGDPAEDAMAAAAYIQSLRAGELVLLSVVPGRRNGRLLAHRRDSKSCAAHVVSTRAAAQAALSD